MTKFQMSDHEFFMMLEKPSGAIISPCSRYRYWLHRRWVGGAGFMRFIMLNPSTADASIDDPTIRRCIGFANDLGFAGIIVVNLHAYRASTPIALQGKKDPDGPENREWLQRAFSVTGDNHVVAAWGTNVHPRNRATRLWIKSIVRPIYCLGVTKGGHPRHPLYIPNGTELQRYTWENGRG